MASHKEQHTGFVSNVEYTVTDNRFSASNDTYDEDEAAQERRREERRRRKKQKRRDKSLPPEEGDPDLLLEPAKKPKRSKKKKRNRPEPWFDESIELDEALEPGAFENAGQEEDWDDEWDS